MLDKDDFSLEKEQFSKEEILGDKTPNDLQAIYNIPVTVSAVLGRATMPINQLLKLGRGAVVELDQKIGDRSGRNVETDNPVFDWKPQSRQTRLSKKARSRKTTAIGVSNHMGATY